MLILVYGGSACGKSNIGEHACMQLGVRRIYVATMRAADDESRIRVARHQAQRADYGFDTVECYHELAALTLQKPYDTAILECMGNLVANEMFESKTPERLLADKVMAGISSLVAQTGNLVVISNAVFGETEQYDCEIQAYLRSLGEINRCIAAESDVVIEAVCGLSLIHKGKGMLA